MAHVPRSLKQLSSLYNVAISSIVVPRVICVAPAYHGVGQDAASRAVRLLEFPDQRVPQEAHAAPLVRLQHSSQATGNLQGMVIC